MAFQVCPLDLHYNARLLLARDYEHAPLLDVKSGQLDAIQVQIVEKPSEHVIVEGEVRFAQQKLRHDPREVVEGVVQGLGPQISLDATCLVCWLYRVCGLSYSQSG